MFSIADAWDLAKDDHQKYVLGQIRKHLRHQAGHPDRITCRPLRRFVIQYRHQIASGNVDELKRLIGIVDAMFAAAGSGPSMAMFLPEAAKIFDYKYFCTIRKKPWCAYELCKTSPYRICPYCGQNFAFTLIGKATSKKFRPTLDHFFPKSVYPYLALSLYNLVPSCHTCNSNLKGATDFYVTPHLHPFALDRHIRFEVVSKNKTEVFQLVSNLQLFSKFATLRIKPESHSAALNSIDTFLLAHRFQMHEKQFLSFAYLRRQLTERRLTQVRRIFGGSVDASTLLGFEAGDFRNQIHGRVLIDLYRQFQPSA